MDKVQIFLWLNKTEEPLALIGLSDSEFYGLQNVLVIFRKNNSIN